MQCGLAWEWTEEKIFDFNLPVGRRVWPAVCLECREDLKERYKAGKLTKTQLIMEFSTISGRIAKVCAVSPGTAARALKAMKNFTPRRRGK